MKKRIFAKTIISEICIDGVLYHHQEVVKEQITAKLTPTGFSGGGSRSTQREPPTMDEQLVNIITCGCESSAPFL
jgi:hypothetical protein